MAYENKTETINTDKGRYIDGIVADDNEFGLTADDLRDINDELNALNRKSKEWGTFDD